MPSKLHIIICSTRPGRVGPAVAHWFNEFAQSQNLFDVSLVDLADFNLPVFDEPKHPSLQQYQHNHTKAWSASVTAADAFVFVTPEYNFNPPPPLVNALDFLYREWNYKPAAFVSYGGISGGMRSVENCKRILTTLKMVPLVEAVTIPFVAKHLDDNGQFQTEDVHIKSAEGMLRELARWTDALKVLREPK